MANVQELANQAKAALDRIAATKDHPDQIQQMVNDAKTKVDELAREAEHGGQAQAQRR